MNKSRVSLLLVGWFGMIASVSADSLDSLATRANVIVVGAVGEFTVSASAISFDLQIERTIAGPNVGPVIHIVHGNSSNPLLAPGNYSRRLTGLWFLISQPSGGFDVAQATPQPGFYGLFLPATDGPSTGAYAYGKTTPLLDVLTLEVASALETSGKQPQLLVEVLGSLDGATVQKVLAQSLASPSAAFRASALAAELMRQHSGSLNTLSQMWSGISNDPERKAVLSALGNMWRDSGPAGVQQLAALMRSTPQASELRQPLVQALAAIHTGDALPWLAQLLDSSDAGERMKGVFGLSSFANGCPVQTIDNVVSMAFLRCTGITRYRTSDTLAIFGALRGTPTQEAALISFWRGWWASHQELW